MLNNQKENTSLCVKVNVRYDNSNFASIKETAKLGAILKDFAET